MKKVIYKKCQSKNCENVATYKNNTLCFYCFKIEYGF